MSYCECYESVAAHVTGIPDFDRDHVIYAAQEHAAARALGQRLAFACQIVGHVPKLRDRNITGEVKWCGTCGAFLSGDRETYDPTAPRALLVGIR